MYVCVCLTVWLSICVCVHVIFTCRGGCRSLSGTSVASPVVAGAVTLLARFVCYCCFSISRGGICLLVALSHIGNGQQEHTGLHSQEEGNGFTLLHHGKSNEWRQKDIGVRPSRKRSGLIVA